MQELWGQAFRCECREVPLPLPVLGHIIQLLLPPLEVDDFLSPGPPPLLHRQSFWMESCTLCFSGPGCPIFPHTGLACPHGEPGDLEEQRFRPCPFSLRSPSGERVFFFLWWWGDSTGLVGFINWTSGVGVRTYQRLVA